MDKWVVWSKFHKYLVLHFVGLVIKTCELERNFVHGSWLWAWHCPRVMTLGVALAVGNVASRFSDSSYEVMHFHFLQHLKWRAFSAGTSRWTNHKTTQWVLIEIFSVSYSLELDSDSLYGHLNFFWILLACGFFRFLFLCRLGTMPPEEVQTCHMI